MARVPAGSGGHKLNQELKRLELQLATIRARLDELEDAPAGGGGAHAADHESGGADEIDLGSLDGTITDGQHGNRGGGALHANAVPGGAAGFLSGSLAEQLTNDDLFLSFGCNTAQNLVALPINGDSIAATTIDIGTANWIAPYDCTVVECVLRDIGPLDYDSTVVATHINGGAAVDSDTHELDVAAGNVTFVLGTDVDAGDRLAVSFDATTNAGELTGYVRIRRR